ncbi:MAG: response regulator transcription factor [Deltaproteobacteria bacterium]|nr:response regulator transcription factor [Deltaproteobacteria bacterium]
MDSIRVLYVEDDERLAKLTTEYLQSHGLEVHWISRGDRALAEVQHFHPDLVLLDLMLPGVHGLEVCRQIRARHDVPIIMVTARTESEDHVRGLDGGADDYVPKPFQSRELLARIHAQVRRARGDVGPKPERFVIGELVVDLSARVVTMRGAPVALTTNELAVLAALAQRPGRVLSRDELLQVVHGALDEAFDRSIDVLISRIRGKLEEDPKNPRLVKTVRGAGYVLTSGES